MNKILIFMMISTVANFANAKGEAQNCAPKAVQKALAEVGTTLEMDIFDQIANLKVSFLPTSSDSYLVRVSLTENGAKRIEVDPKSLKFRPWYGDYHYKFNSNCEMTDFSKVKTFSKATTVANFANAKSEVQNCAPKAVQEALAKIGVSEEMTISDQVSDLEVKFLSTSSDFYSVRVSLTWQGAKRIEVDPKSIEFETWYADYNFTFNSKCEVTDFAEVKGFDDILKIYEETAPPRPKIQRKESLPVFMAR